MQIKLHPSWHFYAGVWGVISGIVFGLVTNHIFITDWSWLLLAGLALGFSLCRANYFAVLLAFSAGFIIGSYRSSFEVIGKTYFSNLAGSEVVINGVIADDPTISKGKASLRLTNLKLQIDDSVENGLWHESAGLAYVQLTNAEIEFERSDSITFKGKLGEGFGNFTTSLYRPTILKVERAMHGDLFARLKHWFASKVRDFVPSPEVDLGLGYLVGMKSGLPEDLSLALQMVGMTHVVVASGTHLGILVDIARKVFGRISRFASLFFSSLLVLSFALIVGFTPSMTRASLVALLSLLASYVGRKWAPLRLLGFVAMITLLISPTYIFNLGWQLSFASFFGILVVGPKLQRYLYGGKPPPWLASMILTSFATSIICAPILVYSFGSLSLLSFVANLIILPSLPYAMLSIFLTGILSPIPLLANLFGKLASLLLSFHIIIVDFLKTKTMFIFELPASNSYIFLVYLPIFLLLVIPAIKKFSKRHFRRSQSTYSKNM